MVHCSETQWGARGTLVLWGPTKDTDQAEAKEGCKPREKLKPSLGGSQKGPGAQCSRRVEIEPRAQHPRGAVTKAKGPELDGDKG